MTTTARIIEYCGNNNLTYRLSSNLFPLITFDKANIYLENLPNYDDIEYEFDYIADMIYKHQVRISLHPSEYNSLASLSKDVTDKTITELNFYSSFMDRIGCPADYRSPMNLHIHNKDGDHESIIARFVNSFNLLDPNCRSRLVIENDDKVNCWSVRELVNIFHAKTNIPITFDYLHHACHPDGLTEQEAIRACHATWGDYTPLFHYSESRPGNNPRAHSDYANNNFNTYDLDFDLDFELKMKDHAISQYLEKVVGV
jgi:UV DNA damage endonuclease